MISPYYQDDSVTLYCADCRDIINSLPRIDVLITDPPYLLELHGGGGGALGKRDVFLQTSGFTDKGVDYSFIEKIRYGKHMYPSWFCFCSRLQLPKLLKIASKNKRWNVITWGKTNPVPTCNGKYLSDTEYIVHVWDEGRLFGDMPDKSSFFVYRVGDKETEHPNEKPLALIQKLVRLGSRPGDIILDPFAGSGTTGKAAKILGRKAILIEREEKYCEIIVKRLAQEYLAL